MFLNVWEVCRFLSSFVMVDSSVVWTVFRVDIWVREQGSHWDYCVSHTMTCHFLTWKSYFSSISNIVEVEFLPHFHTFFQVAFSCGEAVSLPRLMNSCFFLFYVVFSDVLVFLFSSFYFYFAPHEKEEWKRTLKTATGWFCDPEISPLILTECLIVYRS